MAFTNILRFTEPTGGSVTIWDGQALVLLTGVRQSNAQLVWFNPGALSALGRIAIIVDHKTTGGNSSFNMFWRGATEQGTIFDQVHDFWTSIAATTTRVTSMYYTDITNDVKAIGGTDVVSPYMFQMPWIAFGIDNVGANTLTTQYTIFGQKA